MLSLQTKRNIYRIIPFGLIWLFFSLVYTFLERGLVGKIDYYPATGNPYHFERNLIVTSLTALVTGLLTGVLEIFYFNKRFVHRPFIQKLLLKSFIYLGILLSFLLLLTASANAGVNASFFSKQVWSNVWSFVTNIAFVSVLLYITSIILVAQFYAEVREHIGQGVLNNFFTGKYHTPKEEERIFMFLDMKSSTTIAESLGHIRYFEMLRSYYTDLSNPIIDFAGEIYQYVGDEIVVSWTLANGVKNNNCIECFFAMKACLQNQQQQYEEKFGVLPSFKAGFHVGKVTTGEIGAIKKEIVFTGDTLNTAARIQSLCNNYNTDILLSGVLLDKLQLSANLQAANLGTAELRGREESISLYTISKK
ncbi:MAG: adenylate/guanylate cyclase domain-containing protein [Chitinophagaceae bacterium]